MYLEFFIDGEPKAQQRPRLFRQGNFMRAYSPKTNWYMIVYYACLGMKNKTKTVFKTPVSLHLSFFLPIPKSLSEKKKKALKWHVNKPDVDNLAKAVMDAINNAGLWEDDKLVAELKVDKQYGQRIGAKILIMELEP